jgi:hypothetical protein
MKDELLREAQRLKNEAIAHRNATSKSLIPGDLMKAAALYEVAAQMAIANALESMKYTP